MENKCEVCNSEINENMNFCPECGNPITDIAKNVVKEKEKNIKLSLLKDIISVTNDVKSLKVLKAYVTKIIME